MVNKTLYETLGTECTANDEEIKLAYRLKALATHPDRGGNDAEFRRVHNAFLVLSDPQRRRTYDQTGNDAGPEPDNRTSHVHCILTEIFMGLIDAMAKNSADPKQNDLVRCMVSAMNEKINSLAAALSIARDRAKLCAFAKDRFSEPQLEEIRAFALERAKHDVSCIEKTMDVHKEALAVLKKSKYRLPAEPRQVNNSSTTWRGWSSTGS